jgi:hypothetical protein
MEATPVARHPVAAGSQGCRNGSASLRQQGSGEPRHQFPPGGSGKEWPKDHQNLYNGIGKRHEHPPEQDMVLISFYLTSRGFHAWFFPQKCTKSSRESCH